MTNILSFSPSGIKKSILWFCAWQLEGWSPRLMKGTFLDLKRHHAPRFLVVLQMTTDCGNQFVAHNEKAAYVWWGEKQAPSRRENV